MNVWRGMFAALLVVGIVAAGQACDDSDLPSVCTFSHPCVCAAPNACQRSCIGGNNGDKCVFTCAGEIRCDFDCPGGGCTIRCRDNATCAATCAGGGCTMECDGAKDCNLDCKGNNCKTGCSRTESCGQSSCTEGCGLDCGGAVTCKSACQPVPGNCITRP